MSARLVLFNGAGQAHIGMEPTNWETAFAPCMVLLVPDGVDPNNQELLGSLLQFATAIFNRQAGEAPETDPTYQGVQVTQQGSEHVFHNNAGSVTLLIEDRRGEIAAASRRFLPIAHRILSELVPAQS